MDCVVVIHSIDGEIVDVVEDDCGGDGVDAPVTIASEDHVDVDGTTEGDVEIECGVLIADDHGASVFDVVVSEPPRVERIGGGTRECGLHRERSGDEAVESSRELDVPETLFPSKAGFGVGERFMFVLDEVPLDDGASAQEVSVTRVVGALNSDRVLSSHAN